MRALLWLSLCALAASSEQGGDGEAPAELDVGEPAPEFSLFAGDREGGQETPKEYLDRYAYWHNEQLRLLRQNPGLCRQAKVVVWTPVAGLGDSVRGMESAFLLALKHGRLFFVNWKDPVSWKKLLQRPPGLEWDWASAVKSGAVCPDAAAEIDPKATAYLKGHPTMMDYLATADPKFYVQLPEAELLRRLVSPHKEVQARTDKIIQQLDGKHVVGIHIRTGTALPPDPPFLSPGDEENFATCFLNLVKWKKVPKDAVALVLSDSPDAAKKVADMIGRDRAIVPGGNAHSFTSNHVDSVRQSYAEWFAFAHSNTAITTAWSLYSMSSVLYGDVPSDQTTEINDSHCNQPGHKMCKDSWPKSDQFCGIKSPTPSPQPPEQAQNEGEAAGSQEVRDEL